MTLDLVFFPETLISIALILLMIKKVNTILIRHMQKFDFSKEALIKIKEKNN
jgi:hypothetical protein